MNAASTKRITDAELRSLNNQDLVDRWNSIQNGELREFLLVDEWMHENTRVLEEMGIRFPQLLKDSGDYLLASERLKKSSDRNFADSALFANEVIEERNQLRKEVAALTELLQEQS